MPELVDLITTATYVSVVSMQVIKLKAMLSKQQGYWTQKFGGYTEISGEETVESTSEGLTLRGKSNIEHVADQGYCSFTVEDYNTTVSLPHCHWPVVPY